MGIQSLVVVIGVAAALGVGLITSTVGASGTTAGLIAVGFMPLMWALTHAIERLIGRDIWHYSAPYPYRGMEAALIDVKPSETNESDTKAPRDDRHYLRAASKREAKERHSSRMRHLVRAVGGRTSSKVNGWRRTSRTTR
jgi:hypothetical protein